MRSGGTPNFCVTPSTSSFSSVMVLISDTEGLTSCAKSLSPVEMMVSQPASVACLASVPMTSSASTPETIKTGQPKALTNS